MVRTVKKVMLLACCVALLALCGCGHGQASDAPADYNGRTLDILMSLGGYNNYFEPVVARMFELCPGLTINLSYEMAAPELMRVRTLASNLPDIFNINQTLYKYSDAIADGLCMPLNGIFELPTIDGAATLRDIYDMDSLYTNMVDGSYYLIGDIVGVSGLWYDGALLERLGLEPPRTWDDLHAAARVLDGQGIYALGWCGQMAEEYALHYLFAPMLHSESAQAFIMLDEGNLNAFDTPAMRTVLGRLVELRDNGWFDSSTLELMNLKAQSLLMDNHMGFYPCGSWLEGETAHITPPGFELCATPVPVGKSGAPAAVFSDTIVSAVASTTINFDLAGEFYRVMLSDPVAIEGQVRIHENAMAIKDFFPQYGHLMSRTAQQLWRAIDSGEAYTFEARRYISQGEFADVMGEALCALMSGSIDADGFCRAMRAELERIKSQ